MNTIDKLYSMNNLIKIASNFTDLLSHTKQVVSGIRYGTPLTPFTTPLIKNRSNIYFLLLGTNLIVPNIQ